MLPSISSSTLWTLCLCGHCTTVHPQRIVCYLAAHQQMLQHDASISRMHLIHQKCSLAARRSLPDADVAANLAISLLLRRDVHQGIFAKHRFGVQICSQVAALAMQGRGGCEAAHVGAGYDVRQKGIHIRDGGIDGHLRSMPGSDRAVVWCAAACTA